jgi:curved DNA-binding protein CbpA
LSEDALERISDLGVFGLPEGATQDEIRKAYRIEVFLTHTDRLQGMSDEFKAHATERLKRVNIAYQRLKE